MGIDLVHPILPGSGFGNHSQKMNGKTFVFPEQADQVINAVQAEHGAVDGDQDFFIHSFLFLVDEVSN